MTREELAREEYSLSRVITTSEEKVYPPSQPTEDDLETYFQTLFQLEPIPTPIEAPEPIKTPEDQRRQMLDNVLSKLSVLEIGGKEYIEEYGAFQRQCLKYYNICMFL